MIPLQLFVATLVGWLQGDQHKVIEYLREENRVLKAQLQNRLARTNTAGTTARSW